MSIGAMRQALEALEFEAEGWENAPPITREAIAVLRGRLAQPEPRQWVGLTEEEIFKVENAVPDEVIGDSNWCVYFAKAIEAKLKEKNT